MATAKGERDLIIDRPPVADPPTPTWNDTDLVEPHVKGAMSYVGILRQRLGRIVLAATVAMIATGFLTAFVLTKWYRAEALIRPVAQATIQARLAGMAGAIGGSLSEAESLFGFGGSSDAEEYIAILKSFNFNISLVRRHHLERQLLGSEDNSSGGGVLSLFGVKGSPVDPEWQIYRIIKSRFDAEYSIRTGNIELSYIDKDRFQAQRILQYYVDDLRDLLRKRTIEDTSAAIKSMIAEADTTPDTLLQARLYELIARQMQERKLAEVEADFAFRVLEPPVASDKPYSPRVLVDSVIVGFLVATLYAMVILLRFSSGAPRHVGIAPR